MQLQTLVVAFFVYQIGTLITAGTVGNGFIPGLVAVIAIAAYVISLIKKTEKNMAAEYALKKELRGREQPPAAKKKLTIRVKEFLYGRYYCCSDSSVDCGIGSSLY